MEGDILSAALNIGDLPGIRLSVGVDHHAVGVQNGDVPGPVRDPQVRIALLAGLDGEAAAAVGEGQVRPAAGDGVLTGKDGVRQHPCRRVHAAAQVGGRYRHGLGALEEQTEGDGVQELAEGIPGDGQLRLRRGDIRHAGDGDGQVALHAGDQALVEVHIAHAAGGLAVDQQGVIRQLGVAGGDIHPEPVILPVADGGLAGEGEACAGGRCHGIGPIHRHRDSGAVAGHVYGHDLVGDVVGGEGV